MAAALWYGVREIASGKLTPGSSPRSLPRCSDVRTGQEAEPREREFQQASAASERIVEILDLHSEVEDRPGAVPSQVCFAKSSSAMSASATTTTGRDHPARRVARHPPGPDGGRRGAERRGRHAGQPAAGSTTSRAGPSRSMVPTSGFHAALAAVADRHRHAGACCFDDTIAGISPTGRAGQPGRDRGGGARANAHAFIAAMPDGYQTVIGERASACRRPAAAPGHRASAAEERADPDPREATSSLDAESERLVQGALGNLMANRTPSSSRIACRRSDGRLDRRAGTRKDRETGGTRSFSSAPWRLRALYEMQLAAEHVSACRRVTRDCVFSESRLLNPILNPDPTVPMFRSMTVSHRSREKTQGTCVTLACQSPLFRRAGAPAARTPRVGDEAQEPPAEPRGARAHRAERLGAAP